MYGSAGSEILHCMNQPKNEPVKSYGVRFKFFLSMKTIKPRRTLITAILRNVQLMGSGLLAVMMSLVAIVNGSSEVAMIGKIQ